MRDGTSDAVLLDAFKTSATKFRDTNASLEPRGRELDGFEARLAAERKAMGRQAAEMESTRASFRREREELAQARSNLDDGSTAIEAERQAVAADARRLQERARALAHRDQALLEAEDRLQRHGADLSRRIEESTARLRSLAEREDLMAQRERDFEETVARLTAMVQAAELREKRLAEREEAFVRRQNERHAALSAREDELTAYRDAIAAAAADTARQADAYVALNTAIGNDMDRVVVARASLVAEDERLREAEAVLAGTTDMGTADSERRSEPVRLVSSPEPEARSSTTKEAAVDRLAEVVLAWGRARAAGWDVSTLRGPARSARNALASGDYEGAVRLAAGILDRLQTRTDAA